MSDSSEYHNNLTYYTSITKTLKNIDNNLFEKSIYVLTAVGSMDDFVMNILDLTIYK